MDWIYLALILYLIVGLLRAVSQISRGIKGTMGPFVTLVAVTLLWPILPKD
jgi:hypothetical protein